jgi:hypothetical protein
MQMYMYTHTHTRYTYMYVLYTLAPYHARQLSFAAFLRAFATRRASEQMMLPDLLLPFLWQYMHLECFENMASKP